MVVCLILVGVGLLSAVCGCFELHVCVWFCFIMCLFCVLLCLFSGDLVATLWIGCLLFAVSCLVV